MRRYAYLLKVLGAVGIVISTGLILRASEAFDDRLSEAPCVYYQGSCISMGALTGGGVRMLP